MSVKRHRMPMPPPMTADTQSSLRSGSSGFQVLFLLPVWMMKTMMTKKVTATQNGSTCMGSHQVTLAQARHFRLLCLEKKASLR